jgi:two-component system cell cycle response regulator
MAQLRHPAADQADKMASERSRVGGAERPAAARLRLTFPVVLAAVAVSVAVVADAMIRCLNRTARLTREIRELAVLSRTDPLTGLYNRRHVEEHLAAAASAARRHQQPLSVLFIDIDRFKAINDQAGYEAGDEVLRAVADRLRAALRTEDVVGRWGGDEFLAVLPTTDLAGAKAVADRVRAEVASRPVPIDDTDTHPTVSVGCVSGEGDPAVLIRQASRAVRRAKQAGKNRAVAADPSTE